MSDLVHGRYPIENPLWGQLGQATNTAQSDIPAFHNLPQGSVVEDAAAFITKEVTLTPFVVPLGTTITSISIINGATESETITHAYAAVYSGVGVSPGVTGAEEFKPVLQAQSKDLTTYEAKKVETKTFTLEKTLLVNSAVAPNGYVYIGVYLVGTKVGTYASFKCPATALFKAPSGLKVYPWLANAPIYSKFKPTESGVAPKEPNEVVLVATAPVLIVQ